jgi:hypothetical protein
MKHHQQRDLLVLLNNDFKSQQAIDHEVEWLHDVLFHVESIQNFCIAHELIKVNRNQIINNREKIKKAVLQKTEKPFEFLSNKN